MRALALIATLFAASTLVSCNGDDDATDTGDRAETELTIGNYFERMQAFSDDADAQAADLEEEFADVADFSEFDPDLRDEFADYFEATLEFGDDLINEIEDLNPPAEVAAAHQEFVEAYRAIYDEFGQVADDLDSIDDDDDFTARFLNTEFIAAGTRFESACNAVEDLAQENNISIDLECEG